MSTPELTTIQLAHGWGDPPRAGQTVTVHYSGFLADGTLFDSSVDRGEPFAFVLGAGQVIQGWDLVLARMCVGERLKVIIPAELAYGPTGYPGVIPPNAQLTFDVHLIGIQ